MLVVYSGKTMEESSQYAYIVDVYNPYNKEQNNHVIFKCKIWQIWYAVFALKLSWGQPILDGWPADTSEFNSYHIYSTAEEAISFLHELKQLEGMKF